MCDGNSQFCVRKRKRKGDARSAFQQHIALKMLRVRTKTFYCDGHFLSGTETREARFSSRSR